MADCAPSEFRRRSVAISNALWIAHRDGIGAAHKHLLAVVAEAESGEFTRVRDRFGYEAAPDAREEREDEAKER